MAKLFNRAKMTTSTTGSGTITLGSASIGFQSFADAGVSDGDVVQYTIEDGANFEIGTGTYSSSGTTLTRTPTESSNSGSAINLSGTASIFITAVADDLKRLQLDGTTKVEATATGATVTGNLAVTGTVDGRDVAADGTKLDSIQTDQDLTTTSDVTFNDVTVSGDLTVSGTTTTINTETINLADNQIVLNSNYTGSTPTEDAGIEIERGTLANKTLVWDETNDRWTVGSETFVAGAFSGDGSSLTNVPAVSVYVNEATDTETDRNIIFASGANTGSDTQLEVKQDAGGITFNPYDNTLKVNNANFAGTIEVGFKIQHQNDSNTYISFTTDTTYLQAGGNTSINIDGINDNVEINGNLHLGPTDEIIFDGVFNDGFETRLKTGIGEPTADRIVTLPDATGTLALDDVATTSADGLLSSSDKTKLDGIESGATADQTAAEIKTAYESNANTNAFTDTLQTKLNGIEDSADVTDATNVQAAGALMDSEVTNLAQVKAFDSADYATAAQGALADSAQQPPSEGAFVDGDKTKLDSIETGADVTDTANVTAAGALMDSEVTNLAQVKAFDSSDYATAAQGTTADAALPKAGGTMTGNITFAATQTFDAADLTGTLPAIDGSNLTNVEAASIYVTESSDTNAFFPILFSDSSGSGGVQRGAVQDRDGYFNVLSFNPSTNKLLTDNILLYGEIEFQGTSIDSNVTTLTVTDPTADRTITLPDATGTVALTSDLYTDSDVDTHLNTSTASNGEYLSWNGSDYDWAAVPAGYSDSDVNTHLNQSSAGTNQILSWNGSDYAWVDDSDTTYSNATTSAAGLMSSTDKTKLDGIETGATADQTKADIDALNIDADTVDGLDASSFLRSNTNDTASGRVDFSAGITAQTLDIGVTGDRTIQALSSDANFGSYGDLHLQHYGGNLHMLHGGGTAYIDDNIVWHAGNDGSGSGLDADLLDGQQGSYYETNTANVTAAGALMDSECTSLASVKALDQGVATTDSPSFAGLTVDNILLQDSADRSGLLEISSSASYQGIQIKSSSTAFWSVMANQNDFLIYDDYNSDVIFRYNENSTTELHANGTSKVTIGTNDTTFVDEVKAPWFEATSDINLKENIVQVKDSLSKIEKLNGYTYNFKDKPEVPKAGLIAQEVQEVLPEAVKVDGEGVLRLDYNGTIALLVEAIKDQQKQIDNLKGKLINGHI